MYFSLKRKDLKLEGEIYVRNNNEATFYSSKVAKVQSLTKFLLIMLKINCDEEW